MRLSAVSCAKLAAELQSEMLNRVGLGNIYYMGT